MLLVFNKSNNKFYYQFFFFSLCYFGNKNFGYHLYLTYVILIIYYVTTCNKFCYYNEQSLLSELVIPFIGHLLHLRYMIFITYFVIINNKTCY